MSTPTLYGLRWPDASEAITEFALTQKQLKQKKPRCGFHYTNVNNLNLILSSGKFFSTSIRYLNDPSEYYHGFRSLSEHLMQFADSSPTIKNSLEKILTEQNPNILNSNLRQPRLHPFDINPMDLYTFSMCADGDSLNQWECYARESGVAIQLDLSVLQKKMAGLAIKLCEPNRNTYFPLRTEPLNILYLADEKKKLARVLIEEASLRYRQGYDFDNRNMEFNLTLLIAFWSSFIKDPRYRLEQEIRVSTYPYYDSNKNSRCELVFTENQHVLKPHIPLYCFPIVKNELNTNVPSGWPIQSIIVGPGHNQETVYESLIYRLECGETHVFAYSQKEICRRKIQHFLDALDAGKHPEGSPGRESEREREKRVAKEWKIVPEFDQIQKNALTAPIASMKLLQALKNKPELVNHVQAYEKRIYCTHQGIILKRSTLPYIFSSH